MGLLWMADCLDLGRDVGGPFLILRERECAVKEGIFILYFYKKKEASRLKKQVKGSQDTHTLPERK